MLTHNTTRNHLFQSRNQKARLMFKGLGFFPTFSESLIAKVYVYVSLLKGYDNLSHLKELDQNLWIQHMSLEKSDNSFSISSGVKLSSFHHMANYKQENQNINFCVKNTIQPPSLITLFSRLLSANYMVNLGRLFFDDCRSMWLNNSTFVNGKCSQYQARHTCTDHI